MKFKGGKGIATLTGLIIAIAPVSFLCCLMIFFLTLFLSGYVSLSSILGSLTLPISIIFLEVNDSIIIFSIIIPCFVLITHKSNIKRILNGTENKFDKIKIFK